MAESRIKKNEWSGPLAELGCIVHGRLMAGSILPLILRMGTER